MYFHRGQEYLLDQIKRKSTAKSQAAASQPGFVTCVKNEPVFITKLDSPDREELVTEFLTEMGHMKERQEDLDNKMEGMRSENEALWGEVLSLRQKHHQQQKIVNKLIQFLSALLQPRGMKRSFGSGARGSFTGSQLAIEDVGVEIVGDSVLPGLKIVGDSAHAHVLPGGASPAKQPRMTERIQELPANLDPSQLSSVLDNIGSPDMSSGEPVVDIIIDQADQVPPVSSGMSDMGGKYRMVDPVSVNSSLVPRPGLQRQISREDFDHVINANEKDLDNLKDILSGQITLDTSLVSSLFNTTDQEHNSEM